MNKYVYFLTVKPHQPVEALKDTRHKAHDVRMREWLLLLPPLISLDRPRAAPGSSLDLTSTMREASGPERLGRVLPHAHKETQSPLGRHGGNTYRRQ